MKDINKYRGIIPAFYACYAPDGSISTEGVKALTRHLIAKGVKGVYVGGSSGECIYQHPDERKAVLEAVMSEAKGKITVIAHVACNNTADSVACEMNDRVYREPGNRMGKVAAAIWPWKCKDALLRCNEAVDTRLNQDGMAYDADSGDGTVYEHNYSRMNEGGCVMFCLEEAIHSRFCNNVSFDDLSGTISPAQNPDALLSHNRYYVRKGIPFVRKNMDGGTYTQKADEIILLEEEER